MPNTTPSTSKPASSMADLMASYKTSFQTFHKGDLVKGHITKLTKNEVIVDINAKTEAIVLEKDRNIMNSIYNSLKVGDEVEVSILSPESDSGNPIVSLRRFLSNIAWHQLEQAQKEEKQMEVTVTDSTKGGAVVVTQNGLGGFLPNSHISGGDQQPTPGKKVKVRVLELARKENKIIFSQKSTISTAEFEAATKQFKSGSKVEVTVANITPFGIFVTLPVEGKEMTLDGLIHISEISWEKVEDINQLYTVGQKLEAVIIGFDKEARRTDLSVKRLTADPFEKIAELYPLEKKVSAVITKIDDTGAYLDLGEGIEGVIRKEKIPPTVIFQEGQTVTATVTELDKKRHRISLVPVLKEKPLTYR